METLCTIIATTVNGHFKPFVRNCVPLKEALDVADELKRDHYSTVRVYAETNGGTTLTLIYQPT